MLVFSSAEMTKTFFPKERPFHFRSYRSRTRPALVSKSGSRGKIQQRCCQGRMASSCSQRHSVLPLILATQPCCCTKCVSSETLHRANGCSWWAGNSQASALIRTTSSGGKRPGAPRSRLLLESGQPFGEEPLAPKTDDLPPRIQSLRDLVIRHAFRREQDHPRAHNLKVWQRIFGGAGGEFLFLLRAQRDGEWTRSWHAECAILHVAKLNDSSNACELNTLA